MQAKGLARTMASPSFLNVDTFENLCMADKYIEGLLACLATRDLTPRFDQRLLPVLWWKLLSYLRNIRFLRRNPITFFANREYKLDQTSLPRRRKFLPAGKFIKVSAWASASRFLSEQPDPPHPHVYERVGRWL